MSSRYTLIAKFVITAL